MSVRSKKSIGIIGAGPAGITMAYQLYQQGFRDITVIDQGSEVGGQSTTLVVDGHKSELATCYLSFGYWKTKKLIKSVGHAFNVLPGPTVLDADGQAIPKPKPPLKTLIQYLWKWRQWKKQGQLERPDDPQNALSFDQWLSVNNVAELAEDFTFSAGLTAQLYGPAHQVTAYSGLQWMRPSIFVSGKFGLIYETREGFQNLWKEIVRKHEIKTILNARVTRVDGFEGGARVSCDEENQRRDLNFDAVVISTPLEKVNSPLSAVLQGHEPFDYTYAYSAVWQCQNWPESIASRAYMAACRTNEYNTPLSIRLDGTRDGKSTGQLVGYVHRDAKKEEVSRSFIHDFQQVLGVRDVEVIEDRIWEYNIRYSPAQLRAGLPCRIDNAQGVDHVWYSGGALSHWNVESILNFNEALALRFTQQYSNKTKS